MQVINFSVRKEKILGDLATPVGVYLNLRTLYPGTILLESSDYNSVENASSFIAFQPIATINVKDSVVRERIFQQEKVLKLRHRLEVVDKLQNFFNRFSLTDKDYIKKSNAIFGYIAFDAVQYFENIRFSQKPNYGIPDIKFSLYKYVIEFKHFSNEIIFIELLYDAYPDDSSFNLKDMIAGQMPESDNFQRVGDEIANMEDEDFIRMVNTSKQHCKWGNVFQMVPSRRFKQQFTGDDFLLYRALRSINPSPYQFYFDYGNFHLLGASPETQIKIKKRKAYIFPIAGTFKRTGNETEDLRLARQLKKDPKEMAEHTMLVDLARNDLSKNGRNIRVEKFSEIQFFSHVIHLVSRVSGDIERNNSRYFNIVSNTFPAGTLSGAPKYKAMELIDALEPTARSFYGGAVGTVSFNREVDLAIMIRSFLSIDNTLYYQAGAGIVERSVAENELQEVNNKLAALRKSIEVAETIFNNFAE